MLRQLLSLSTHGDVAQLGERGVRNAEAEGSSPFISTKIFETLPTGSVFFVRGPHRGARTRKGGTCLWHVPGGAPPGAKPQSVAEGNAASPFISTTCSGVLTARAPFFFQLRMLTRRRPPS